MQGFCSHNPKFNVDFPRSAIRMHKSSFEWGWGGGRSCFCMTGICSGFISVTAAAGVLAYIKF